MNSSYKKEDIKLYKDLLSNLNKDNKKLRENILCIKKKIEKERKEMEELNNIDKRKKELKEKISYSKDFYDGILIKIQMINKEIKYCKEKNKVKKDKIKEINNLKTLIEEKKKKVEDLRNQVDKLNNEIKNINSKNNYKQNENSRIPNNGENLENTNRNKIIFNGIDEIIQEINNNYIENEQNKSGINEIHDISKGDEKDLKKEQNFANFVFDINMNLNENKDNKEKDFGIESVTERKDFEEFNFD